MLDHFDQDFIDQGQLTRVDVSPKSRKWTFHIRLPQLLKYEDYAVLRMR